MKKKLIYILIFIFSVMFITVSIIMSINYYVLSFSNANYYYDVDGLDKYYVGLVFGASVIGNSIPSDILKDRLKVAYEAYIDGKIEKIIVSGDNSYLDYNEPKAMKKYLIELGVDDDDIYLDYAGFDTYDSLYRAKYIFGVDTLVLFTQDFHLKRAMYIGQKLGLNTIGVETNLQKYLKQDYYNRRELFARIKAFLNVEIFKPESKYLGDKIEILSDEKIEEAKKGILEK
ncbi:MAG: ElyC/SanA/YdcF family protein [Candidatus Gracilibacteria bacterium]|nr:ElyC/SanA/YdcF family protein [Candidatus Gracilibacteria bacterium]